MNRADMVAEARRCIALAYQTGGTRWLRAARSWLLAAQARRVMGEA